MTAPTFAFLVLQEHPYGREMLRQLLAAGFAPAVIIEECSAEGDLEREKFLVRIFGHTPAPTFDELLAAWSGPTIRRERVGNHNDPRCREIIDEVSPQLLVLGGTRILKPHIFEGIQMGALNSHPGLLPEVRGSASVAWAIELDEKIGCTCHFIEAGIDTGPICFREELAVSRADTYESLCFRTIELSGRLMTQAVSAMAEGTLRTTAQGAGPKALRNMPNAQVEAVKRKLASGGYAHYVD